MSGCKRNGAVRWASVTAAVALVAVSGCEPAGRAAPKSPGRTGAPSAQGDDARPQPEPKARPDSEGAEEKGMLKDADRKAVAKRFEEIREPVKIVMFTQETECEYCSATRGLVEELAGLSEKLTVEVLDFVKDKARADALGVDKIPALAIMGDPAPRSGPTSDEDASGRDYGIRLFGVPAGYEFSTLIEDIVMVGRREHGLPREITDELAKVDKPVHIQVVVSPTCPYCPRAVLTAHRFAMASDKIRGDMVEGSEFPHLVVKYGVRGVPHTVINEEHSFVGALPEAEAAKAVLKAVGK